MLSHEEQQKILKVLLKRKDNLSCADCGSNSPCWASLQFGVFICLNCSGAHRALGPSITRVKSVVLDSWNKLWLESVQYGNSNINSFYEHEISDSNRSVKPNDHSSVDFITRYVKDKYIKKKYAHPTQTLEAILKSKVTSSPKKENRGANLPRPQSVVHRRTQKTEIIANPPSSIISKRKVEADFTFFDEIVSSKQVKPGKEQPKVSHNLINLEDEKPKKAANFVDFDSFHVEKPKQKEQKYNKQQFLSMGGQKPSSTKPNFDFDTFHHHAQKKPCASNNLISFENNQNKKGGAQNPMPFADYGLAATSQTAASNKNTFSSTMGAFYQTPPSHQAFHGLNTQQVNMHQQQAPQIPKKALPPYQTNVMPKQSFALTTQKPEVPAKKITLEPTMNFQIPKAKAVNIESGPRSWADDWK